MYLQIVIDLFNAGDLLAPIIVERLFDIKITKIFKKIPKEITDADCPVLAGLGSFLGYYGNFNIHVWGTGFEPGYINEKHIQNPGNRKKWKYYAVRGMLTKRYFDLPDDIPIGDPAILAPLFYTPSVKPQEKYRYILHYDNDNTEYLNEYCVISAKMHPYEFIDYITSSDFIFTESLHGAILAHAYGIPWAWSLNKHMSATFKWFDWFSSIGAQFDGFFLYNEIEKAKKWYKQQVFRKIDTSRLMSSFPPPKVLSTNDSYNKYIPKYMKI